MKHDQKTAVSGWLYMQTNSSKWRLLDTGLLSAAQNMALDQVLLEAVALGRSPNTLRFLQFNRPSILLGYHQDLAEEVRVEFCRSAGVEINRRITGGGAIFFEPSHIGWEIIATRDLTPLKGSPQEVTRCLCEAFARALEEGLGIPARFRPRNDIEVHGRKISGTGGTQQGQALLFQGTLLVDLDINTMLRSLRVPMEKLKAHEVDSIRDRVITLRELLGRPPSTQLIKNILADGLSRALGFSLEPGGLLPHEDKMLTEALPRFSSEEWIDRRKAPQKKVALLRSLHRGEGGLIRVALDADITSGRIRSALITGDFFSFPRRAVFNMEAALKDAPLDQGVVRRIIEDFFNRSGANFPSLGPADFIRAVGKAVEKSRFFDLGFTGAEADSIFPVNIPLEDLPVMPLKWMLLPYCAKEIQCDLRYLDRCTECGRCTVGEAYELARHHGLVPLTVTSFEDLMEKIIYIKRQGKGGYLGSCCEGFLVKHSSEFEGAAVPGVLVTMESITCYDLGKSRMAYEGRFENQTELNIPLIRKVLELRQ
jgi:lipoate-protein ligase A